MKELMMAFSLVICLVGFLGCNKGNSSSDDETWVDTPDEFTERCLDRGSCHSDYHYDDGVFAPYDYNVGYQNGFRGCGPGYYPVYDPYEYGLACVSARKVGWDRHNWVLWEYGRRGFSHYDYSEVYWASFAWSLPGYNYVYQACQIGHRNACGGWASCMSVSNYGVIGICSAW